MTIEYMPRTRREEDGWRPPPKAEAKAYSTGAPVTVRDEVDGQWGIRVALRPARLAKPRVVLRPWFVFFILFGLINNLRPGSPDRGSGPRGFTWSWWGAAVVGLLLVVVAYRAMRLHRFAGRDELDLLLTPVGIHTRGLVVPWSTVTEVVRFNFMLGPGPGGPGPRNFLAVRVEDFLAVRGLTPFRAGLANLTRRHLVVLAMAIEVRDPQALARALEILVADPASRELLATEQGLALVGGTIS